MGTSLSQRAQSLQRKGGSACPARLGKSYDIRVAGINFARRDFVVNKVRKLVSRG